jgi:N-acetylmuramoyl-L-alanine amidase
MLVVLDPGHDYKTAGKRSPDGTLLEYEFNQAVADLAAEIISKNGIKVIKTKEKGWTCGSSSASAQGSDLTRRANVANNAKADLFISIHANAASNSWSSAKGWEVHCYPNSKSGMSLSQLAVSNMYPFIAKQGVNNRGIKQSDFAVVRLTHMPAILLECGFFTNQEECAKLKTQAFRLACAQGIAKTVFAFFKMSGNVNNTPTPAKPVVPTPTPTPSTSGTYTVAKGDTLWGLSQKWNVSVAIIKSTNKLTSDTLSIGQKLTVPKTQATPTPVAPVIKLPVVVTVAKGDTLWSLSKKYTVSVDKIKSDNGLKSDTLTIGQKLSIGGKATVTPVTPTPAKPIVPTPTPIPVKPVPVIPATFTITGKTPILGTPVLTAAQLDTFVKKVNPNAPSVAEYYVTIGKQYGIRGDIAFLQAVKETGYFRFGGDVKASQNNFCGLGAVGGGAGGASFASPRQGAIAHLQHLHAYATKNPLPVGEVVIDPRFDKVTKGIAPYFEQLAGRWAVPGYDSKKYTSLEKAWNALATYGQEILALYAQASKVVVVPTPPSGQDGSDKTNPTARTTSTESVLNTVAEVKGKSILAVIIDGNGYVDASDVAELFGYKALYDNVEKKIVFVAPDKLKG